MAIFRKPGRSGQPEPTPDQVADELVGLVEELEPGAPGAPAEGGAGELAEYRAGVERGRRRGAQLVTDISRRLGSGSRTAAKGAAFGGRALADQLLQAAPRIPVRDLATLRAQHPGATDPEQLADLLVTGATGPPALSVPVWAPPRCSRYRPRWRWRSPPRRSPWRPSRSN